MMNGIRIAGIGLIAAGVLGLLFGAFTFTRDAHRLHVGSLELMLKDRETVYVPTWVSLGALAAGGLLLVVPGRKRGA
jgi:hypothetical protein